MKIVFSIVFCTALGWGLQLPASVRMTPVHSIPLHSSPVLVAEKFKGKISPNHSLNIPEGYSVQVFHIGGLSKPRFFAWGPESVLYVANKHSGEIIALPDKNYDGIADTAIVAASGFRKPHDVKFYNNAMYVADETQIFKCEDRNNDGIYETKKVFIDNIAAGRSTGGHDTRTIVFDPQKKKLYLSIGSQCNVCREEHRAVIEQYNDDGTDGRIFAAGIRNAVGMTFFNGRLWAANNGFDWQGDDIPPEWIDVVRDGGFYGYPYAYAHGVWVDFSANKQYQDLLPLTKKDKEKVQSMVQPAALVQAHSAPMAIEFSNASFPKNFQQGAFAVFRGSWNRSVPTGYKIVFLSMNSPQDTVFTSVSDCITGFHDGSARRTLWGRPVGLETDARGNLYFGSDEITEAIFILRPKKN